MPLAALEALCLTSILIFFTSTALLFKSNSYIYSLTKKLEQITNRETLMLFVFKIAICTSHCRMMFYHKLAVVSELYFVARICMYHFNVMPLPFQVESSISFFIVMFVSAHTASSTVQHFLYQHSDYKCSNKRSQTSIALGKRMTPILLCYS